MRNLELPAIMSPCVQLFIESLLEDVEVRGDVRWVSATSLPISSMTQNQEKGRQSGISHEMAGSPYDGMIHDFVLLDAIRDVAGVQAALEQSSSAIRDALKEGQGTRASLKRALSPRPLPPSIQRDTREC